MASLVLKELSRFGPDQCDQLTGEEAVAYTRSLVQQQYENFSVTSYLLPARLRDDFANVYAFCRWADDLGDETGDRDKSLELLAWWQRELESCYRGEPRHPVYIALAQTIEKHDLPQKPFADLIDAFVQDQKVNRYETWAEVIDYCTRSADPVGRLVLYMGGYRDEPRQQLSDQTCTALQLVNFWQDVRRDIVERDRIYLPAEMLNEFDLTHDRLVEHVRGRLPFNRDEASACRGVIRACVERTWPRFEKGHELWPLLSSDLRNPIKLFSLGGEAVMRKIERIHYETIDQRPRLSKLDKAALMLRAALGKLGMS